MFIGYTDEGVQAVLYVDTATADGVPQHPDAPPTYRVFGQSGPIAPAAGAAVVVQSGAVSGATNTSPIVVTSAAHGLATGSTVRLSGVLGNAGANGQFTVTVLTTDSFSLDGSASVGAYTGGGSWLLAGLWRVVLAGAAVASLGAGQAYTLVLSWAVAASPRVRRYTFGVQ